MLIFKIHKMFIKNKKKTKCGKRVYKKKYFTAVYQNDMKIGMITKISISRGTGKLIEPIKPEDCLGYNKELYEFFKVNLPIPVEDTNKYEVSEQDDMESDYINNWIQAPSTIKVIDEQIKTK